MKIICISLSHHDVPVEIREKFYLDSAHRELLLAELKSDPSILETVILSTCNRIEIYAHVLPGVHPETLMSWLFRVKHLPFDSQLTRHFRIFIDQEAVRHFLCVATSLDSLVLGEKQILGQVKDAVDLSRKKGMISREFNILTNMVIRAGKKAQNETLIGFGGVSISWAAVTMAQRILGTLEGRSVLIIGAGKMSKLAARDLANKGIKDIYIMNRTQDKSVSLAEKFGGQAVSFYDLKEILAKVDVCICSSGAPHYIIEKDAVEKIMALRQNKKILFIDISVPRNIHPDVAMVGGATLETIDSLDRVVANNESRRQVAIQDVESIVSAKLMEYYEKVRRCYSYQSESLNELVSVEKNIKINQKEMENESL